MCSLAPTYPTSRRVVRFDLDLLAEMGSLTFEMVLLPVGGDWWHVYTSLSLFMKLASRISPADASEWRQRMCVIIYNRYFG